MANTFVAEVKQIMGDYGKELLEKPAVVELLESGIMEESMLIEALQFAAAAHKGACRKGTTTPYIVHPIEAALVVANSYYKTGAKRLSKPQQKVVAGAFLHDVVEDTQYTGEDIERKFDSRVAALVVAESENKREEIPAEESWKIRKSETIEHLKKADEEAKLIAMGDKMSNLRSMYRDYRQLGEQLWQRFNQKDPAMHGWYYKSLGECFQGQYYYQEYQDLLKKVFK